MSYYKVVIPSAGLGTRLGKYSKHVNKAMVTIANKPAICHVIEKFPNEVPIVIAVGHRGKLLQDFLLQAYPQRPFEFVEIDKYEGVGSGLGYTLLKCEQNLQCPFIFCSNDTIVEEDIPEPKHNWIGYADVGWIGDEYRGIGFMPKLHVKDKGAFPPYEAPYIGLAGICDYKDFWTAMRSGVGNGSITMGESYGLNKLIYPKGKKAYEFTWYDIGSSEGLKEANKALTKNDDIHVLPKDEEAIWFVNDRVFKYHNDPKFITGRVKRAKVLDGYVPSVISKSENFYMYNHVKGNTLAHNLNVGTFVRFLNFVETMWKPIDVLSLPYGSYYKSKTQERVDMYFSTNTDQPEKINGVNIPSLSSMIERVPWPTLNNNKTVIHGDLHPDNVLITESGNFVLLDWRQDFNGCIEGGDKTYDLAKLNHGLIVSHEVIDNNEYSITKNDDVINFDFRVPYKLLECQDILKSRVGINNWSTVNLLTALIFLNNAPLHHAPYNDLLFYLGKYRLWQILQ